METIGIIYEITGNPYFSTEFGGYSNLSEYVYPSEINDICKAVKENGYDYEVIDGAFDLLNREEKLKSECVVFFNKSIGFKGLERKTPVPVLGQLFQLPMIGSTAYTMTLARHKFHTNRLLNGLGFLVPNAYTYYSSYETPKIKTFPVIVKPNAESDSLGIDEKSVCYTLNEVIAKSKEIIEFFGAPAIIEEFIPGDEIKVAVIGNYTDAMVAGAVSVLKKGKPLLDTFQTREDVMSDYLSYSPLTTTGGLSNSVRKLATQIHKALELNDYSRIDFRIGARGAVYCMEVSTHPYIASTNAAFTSAATQKYNSYAEMINAIITTGRKRLKR